VRRFKLFFTAIPALLLLGACVTEDCPPCPQDEDAPVYIRLDISAAMGTRSNPSGGEDGDGLEAGIRNENTINNLSLFFYTDLEAKGPDAAPDVKISHVEYFDDISIDVPISGFSVSRLFRVDGYKPGNRDRVIVAANMGQIPAEGMTLGELRDYLVQAPWSAADNITDYSHFTMASANSNDGAVITEGLTGDKNHPFTVRASVERTAARVDLMFNNVNMPDNSELVYAVTSDSDNGAKVHITHVLPVNAMTQPTYLLKRVTNGEPAGSSDFGDVLICGTEMTADGTDIPANYVVEPHTAAKAAGSVNASTLYGMSEAANIRINYSSYFNDANRISGWLSLPGLVTDCEETGFARTMTLLYTNENTQHKSLHDSRFITGLVIKAVYEPAAIYADASADESSKVAYVKGMDFWQYRPTSQDMTGKCLYFTGREAAEAYRAGHDRAASLTEFKGGVCYYNLWLRHANDAGSDPHATCPMEYAIVRNNIYRVGFSFTGVGTPTPEVREPHNIVTRIFTRKWNFRPQPEVIM